MARAQARSSRKSAAMPESIGLHRINQNKWQIAAVTLLAFILFLGGSSRDDVQSLLILYPVTIAVSFFYGAILSSDEWRRIRVPVAFIAIIFAAILVQLVPMPPLIWQSLPGRDIVIAADRAVGIHDVWRPISMTPDRTVNALWSMFVPLSVLLSLGKIRSDSFRVVAIALSVMAMASSVLGVLQVTSGISSPLYIYDQSGGGFAAAGFFANRNHNATLVACAIPLLFAISITGTGNPALARQRKWFFGFGIVLCLGIVLAIGSRAGVIIALLAVLMLPLISQRKTNLYRWVRTWLKTTRGRIVAAILTIFLIVFVVIGLKTEGIERIVNTDASDARLIYWKPVFGMIEKYFPIGSGFGSFVEIYKVDETFSTLGVSYVNHAHNDLIEVLMTGGVVGGLFLVLAIGGWVRSLFIARRLSFSNDLLVFHRTGALILLMLGAASVTDYPLRTPFLAAVAVVAAVWMGRPSARARAARRDE